MRPGCVQLLFEGSNERGPAWVGEVHQWKGALLLGSFCFHLELLQAFHKDSCAGTRRTWRAGGLTRELFRLLHGADGANTAPSEVLLPTPTSPTLSTQSQPPNMGLSLLKWITSFCSLVNLSNSVVNSNPIPRAVGHPHTAAGAVSKPSAEADWGHMAPALSVTPFSHQEQELHLFEHQMPWWSLTTLEYT